MRSRCVILVLGILFFIHTDSARAQEAAVRAAISQTLAAVNAGESAIIANFFHQDVRGFFVDRANMIEGFSVLVARAAYLTGLQTDLTMSNLKVTVYSNVAVSAALLQGSVTMPAGGERFRALGNTRIHGCWWRAPGRLCNIIFPRLRRPS